MIREGEEEEEEEEEGGGRVVQWISSNPPTLDSETLTKIAKLANLFFSDMQNIKNLLERIQTPTSFALLSNKDLNLHTLIQRCRSNVDSGHYVSFMLILDYIKLAFHLAK